MAFVVSCMMDPGVKAAKEAANMPVVGPRESCMAIASILGANRKTILPRGIPAPQIHDEAEKTYQALKKTQRGPSASSRLVIWRRSSCRR